MGSDRDINENYVLTWEFQGFGFKYLVRLHFCEFQIEVTEVGDRVFQIYIDAIIAEAQADIIAWSGGNASKNLSIALHPAPRRRTKYSDSILNGIEIFKVDNNRSLAGSNPEPLISEPPK
ncbi:hypothetical protein CUMW_282260 [Citrus unshiu]|uniref:Malectin-like domain-containing protein n=1 Tax=Citrus unshiu TaxID=55188 RepID=A0A2H5N268_CITUN|nr:hypothetical protein CUMW_282260 [Citrus unshiu]